MIFNIFKALELTFPQFHVLFIQQWVSLRELEYAFEPHLRYDKLLKLSQHRLSDEILKHIDIDTKFERLIYRLAKRNSQLDEARKTIDMLREDIKQKNEEISKLQTEKVSGSKAIDQSLPIKIPTISADFQSENPQGKKRKIDHMEEVFTSVLKQKNTKPPAKIDPEVAAAIFPDKKINFKKVILIESFQMLTLILSNPEETTNFQIVGKQKRAKTATAATTKTRAGIKRRIAKTFHKKTKASDD